MTSIHKKETIGRPKAIEIAQSMLRFSEDSLFPPMSDEIRPYVAAELAGIFKKFYHRNDGTLGHISIEKQIAAKKLKKTQEARKSA